MMGNDLFSNLAPEMEKMMDGVFLFRNFVDDEKYFNTIMKLSEKSPFRHMVTPGGKKINVAITNSGDAGWYSDRKGYRYERKDPLNGNPWPALPDEFIKMATKVAKKAGFNDFVPDSCLINRYETGTRLTSHADQDEKDFSKPIVSVSLGVSAIFQIYGESRGGKAFNIPLHSGDVLIFGGPARRFYHGVKRLEKDTHPLTGNKRFNLTFRKAL